MPTLPLRADFFLSSFSSLWKFLSKQSPKRFTRSCLIEVDPVLGISTNQIPDFTMDDLIILFLMDLSIFVKYLSKFSAIFDIVIIFKLNLILKILGQTIPQCEHKRIGRECLRIRRDASGLDFQITPDSERHRTRRLMAKQAAQ